MRDFISAYCDQYERQINPDLFNRTFDKPLVDYVIDTCRNLEVIPAIKLLGYEYITDQSRIDDFLDKKWIKNSKIKNNKALERLISPSQSLYDMLVLHFRVQDRGQKQDVTRRIRIPKLIKGRYYMRGGKLVLPLIQVVDNSTFVKGNTLNFKTTLYPIKLTTSRVKLPFLDGEEISVSKFHVDLFKKVTSPLYYFLAQYGLANTIELFRLEDIMCVVDRVIDDSKYMYIRINQNLYIEVHEKGFYAHEFVGSFVGCLYEVLSADKKATLKDVYSREYWLGRLAEIFSKKRNPDKGERVLISFKKITDPYTRARLKLPKYHKRDTFRIVRWMMVNYPQLLTKDSNDLINKRMRINEIQAYYFDNYIARNVYSLLNTDNPPFSKYIRLLNSIGEFTLIRASASSPKGKGAKSSSTSMYRYERYNDFDAIDLLRYTLKGPTGLNGGKHKTSTAYRDIYPSQLGRYDLNVCSASDPGLTGYLCANCQFDETGHFSSKNNEPDVYDEEAIKHIVKKAEEGYAKSRTDHIALELTRDDDGFFHLQKKLTREEMNQKFTEDPWRYGLYWYDGYLRLMPKMDGFDKNGFFHLRKKSPSRQRRNKEPKRDENGFIRLEFKDTKLSKQTAKRGKKGKK